MTLQINPFDDFTKEDLIRVIKQYEQRLANMSERYRTLQTELLDERKYWNTTFAAFMHRIENPNHYAADAEKMAQWLLDLNTAMRPILGIGHKKYGMHDLAYGTKGSAERIAVAKIFSEILNYFDWDDE